MLLGMRYLISVGKKFDRALDQMDYPLAIKLSSDCQLSLKKFKGVYALKSIVEKLQVSYRIF